MRAVNWQRWIRPLLLLCLLCGALSTSRAADEELVAGYVRALRYDAAGDREASMVRLAELAKQAPASIPVHRSLALLAIEQGEATAREWSLAFRKRLRRSRRDVGASIGRALILEHAGRRREAHSLLLSAVMSGARSPLLAGPVCRTTDNPEGLFGWMRARARVIGRDPEFAALRVEVMLACGSAEKAGGVLRAAVARYPQSSRLLALYADWLRADGDARTAGQQAALAVGFATGPIDPPEIRVPRRLKLARALAGAGRIETAMGLLSSLGPLVTPAGDPPLNRVRAAVQAELAVESGRPVRALELLEESGKLTGDWQEVTRSVHARALADLGLEDRETPRLLRRALPQGLAAADRTAALAQLARREDPLDPALPAALDAASARLGEAGLARRSAQVDLLLAYLSEEAKGRPLLERAAAWLREQPRSTSAPLEVVGQLIEAQWAWTRRDWPEVRRHARLPALETSAAPGKLLAALHMLAARASLAMKDRQGASDALREALLDLQEADLERLKTPQELRPLEQCQGDPAARLPGLAFAADLAAGVPLPSATAHLLRNLSRTTRGWSILGQTWGDDIGELQRALPKATCLILATSDASAPAVALGRDAPPISGNTGEILSAPICQSASMIYWAGPAPPPVEGLFLPENPKTLLVRLVRPVPLEPASTAPAARTAPSLRPRLLGPGRVRPLRSVVERLAGAEAAGEEAGEKAPPPGGTARWPVYHGAGLAPALAPLATGWLAPVDEPADRGWIDVGHLARTHTDGSREGLMVLGLKEIGGRDRRETGLWVLAEAALEAGHPWALLSTRPLSREQIQPITARLDRWSSDPVGEARRLVRRESDLAGHLTLWTAPGRMPAPPRRRWIPLLGLVAIALALAFWLWQRRRSPVSAR